MYKFHDDPTVNKYEIIILLDRLIWVYARKKKAQWDGHFFH